MFSKGMGPRVRNRRAILGSSDGGSFFFLVSVNDGGVAAAAGCASTIGVLSIGLCSGTVCNDVTQTVLESVSH